MLIEEWRRHSKPLMVRELKLTAKAEDNGLNDAEKEELRTIKEASNILLGDMVRDKRNWGKSNTEG